MFRDFKEYQDLEKLYKKVYESKEIDKENLEERRGSSVEQLKKNRETVLPATPPQKGAGGGVGNPTNVRGSGAKSNPLSKPMGAAQGRTKRPQPEIKKFPSTAEIRAANQGRVGGGNAGASTDSGGTSKSTIKSVEQKPEIKPEVKKPEISKFTKQGKPRTKAQMMAAKRIASGKTISDVKAENQASMKSKAAERFAAFKAKRAEKKAGMANEEFTPYDIVLEYLLSSEQVATIEEANYVMTEMDAETIQGIVEEQKKTLTEKPGDGYIGPKFLNIKNPVSKFINKMRDESPIGGNKRVDDTRKGSGDKKVGEKIYYGK